MNAFTSDHIPAALAQRLANPVEPGQLPAPRVPFDLEDFAAETTAGDCLHAFLTAVTNEDVELVTVADHEAMVADLRRLQQHVAGSRSLLMRSLMGTAVALAEHWLEVAADRAQEQRISDTGERE